MAASAHLLRVPESGPQCVHCCGDDFVAGHVLMFVPPQRQALDRGAPGLRVISGSSSPGSPSSMPSLREQGQDQHRALRGDRAALLVGVGLLLVTHAHADWADLARRFAEEVGLGSSRNETGWLISRLGGFGLRQAMRLAENGCGLLRQVTTPGTR
jgi:hypothetical protein